MGSCDSFFLANSVEIYVRRIKEGRKGIMMWQG